MRIFYILSLAGVMLVGCQDFTRKPQTSKTEDSLVVYTFYRNSILDPGMRIHVATFDSQEGGEMNPDYNRAACEEAARLYGELDVEQKSWWCEKGRYRP